MSNAREAALGKWGGILGKWLDERALAGRHTACPMCGGRDRFRFDDKGGCGTWICSHCGAGDGFGFLMQKNGWDFREAAQYVETMCGRIKAEMPRPERCQEKIRADLRATWAASQPVVDGDPVSLYLTGRRCIGAIPKCIRYHAELPYWHDDKTVTKHPAMLAQVVGADGASVTIHRTYLTATGTKADLPSPRKLMGVLGHKMTGAAVRLSPVQDSWLGVAEGIETAWRASIIHKIPVWSCINAGALKTFRPPEDVQMLVIFGDNDQNYTGQAAAYELARSVSMTGIEVRVAIPIKPGNDWADE